MRVLIDGGSSGSGGYVRYLRGILGAGSIPSNVQTFLLCSPELATMVGEVDGAVRVLEEPQLSAARRPARLLWWLTKYPKVVQGLKPDIVLHPSGFKRGRTGGLPSVVIHQNLAPFIMATYRQYGFSSQSLEFLRWRVRLSRSFRQADGVIFLAEHAKQGVCGQVRGIKRSVVIPNALEPPFRSGVVHCDVLSSPVNILCVSSIHLFKHQWNVVKAVASLRREMGVDLFLTVVGGGEPTAQKKLRLTIRECHAEHFTAVIGSVDLDGMQSLYRAADLFVFPSSVECWPITLAEAMGAGLPIACSDRMGMPEILRDGGRYFDPEDYQDIAATLRDLLMHPDHRRDCAQKARQYAEEYRWESSAAEVYRFLDAVALEDRA